MLAVKGYVDGNTVVAEDFISSDFDGKNVIITILDTVHDNYDAKKCFAKKQYTDEDVAEAFGMWEDYSETENVAEYVRSIRRGRSFEN